MSKIYELIETRRSIRKFMQKPVSNELLLKFVNAARFAPSAANIQPCEYVIVSDKEKVKRLFPYLNWASYIHPLGKPAYGEEPVAYIAVLINLRKKKKNGDVDAAAGIQNILLCAWEYGIGTCWIKSLKRKRIKKNLCIPHNLKLDSVIALGYPGETPILEEVNNSIKYFKDKDGVLHVPKRKLLNIAHKNQYGQSYMLEDRAD